MSKISIWQLSIYTVYLYLDSQNDIWNETKNANEQRGHGSDGDFPGDIE